MTDNNVIRAAKELVERVTSLDNFSAISSFTVSLDGSRFSFVKNKNRNAPFIGLYEIINTNEPEFADAVVAEANKLLKGIQPKDNTPSQPNPNLDKMNTELRKSEEPIKLNKSTTLAKKEKAVDPLPVDFFSPPKSTAEDIFNLMYREYSSGMINRLRLYTRFGYIIFDSMSVRIEDVSEPHELLVEMVTYLNDLWKEQKPVKTVFTKYELLRDVGIA